MARQEKRKTQRRKIQIPVLSWEESDVDRKHKGREIVSKDISGDGIAFYSKKIYPIHTVLQIDIFLPNQKDPVSCKLRVASIEILLRGEEYLIGAAFFDLKPEDRLRIASAAEKMDLYVLLDSTVTGGATDLHLTVGRPPLVRRGKKILTMAASVIEPGQVEAMLYPLMTRQQVGQFEESKEMDFAFSPDVSTRFRVNMHSQKGYVEAVLRNIPSRVRSIEELGIPVDVLEKFCREESGLILIAGTRGAGKTTTMMSMVDHINKNQDRVIVTLEDPIEYILKSQRSIVKQRELGADTFSYGEGLKRAMRQDLDVICVGEIHDGECLINAISAAETSHLVISTVHAPDAVSAIERMVNFCPPEHAVNLRQRLASCLRGILYQERLKSGQTQGHVVATELLLNNTAMKNLIRDGRYSMMGNVLQTGRAQGMYTFKDNLRELFEKGLIDQETMEGVTEERKE